jgi:16S rRNA (uracil1498-N3)-methyltransferase
MTVRYFVPHLPKAGGAVSLPEAESHHATSVMRVRVGGAVVLFDGRGFEADAAVESVSRRDVSCLAGPPIFRPRQNANAVTMAVAMPKGDRARELVERLTELGVDELVPLECERSPWAISDAAVQKWERVMVEACKQCGRNRFMEIGSPKPLAEYFGHPLAAGEVGWFAHPGGATISSGTDLQTESPASVCRVAVGPEGGFTDREAAIATAAGWTSVGLGERIYRIETAAVIMAVKAAGI